MDDKTVDLIESTGSVDLELLDAVQIGRLIGRHPETVRHMIRKGEIGHVRDGKFVRVRRSQLQAWIDAHTVEPLDVAG